MYFFFNHIAISKSLGVLGQKEKEKKRKKARCTEILQNHGSYYFVVNVLFLEKKKNQC